MKDRDKHSFLSAYFQWRLFFIEKMLHQLMRSSLSETRYGYGPDSSFFVSI